MAELVASVLVKLFLMGRIHCLQASPCTESKRARDSAGRRRLDPCFLISGGITQCLGVAVARSGGYVVEISPAPPQSSMAHCLQPVIDVDIATSSSGETFVFQKLQ